MITSSNFPKETSVISLDPTIQILFVLDKDISDIKKILNVCRPWNYVRMVVYEGGLEDYSEHYDKISEYRYVDDYHDYYNVDFIIQPLYFENPRLKGNKDIELIKNNIPQGIIPHWGFRKDNGRIYGCFRKKGWLEIFIWEDKVKLVYNRKGRCENYYKGYYHYTYNNIQEAIPMIKELIGKMGYV